MRLRVRTALVVWLVGAVGLFVYPPVQGVAHTDPAGAGEPTEPDFVFDAAMARWRGSVDDFRAGRTTYTFRVFAARLAAQLALWTAFIAAGLFVGGRVARWPGPAGMTVRWAALVAAGFASANVGLALLMGHPDLDTLGRLIGNGEWAQAAGVAWEDLFCWGYGFVLPYAVLEWGLGVLFGFLRRPEAGRDWAKEGSAGWVKGTQQWPREHWLGGPAKR